MIKFLKWLFHMHSWDYQYGWSQRKCTICGQDQYRTVRMKGGWFNKTKLIEEWINE